MSTVRDREPDDAGVTLIEVLVSMTLMSIVMVLATTGMLEIFRGANRTEAGSVAQDQLNGVFGRLDKEIRYAAGISLPGTVGANPYVEYLIANSASPVCTQLRLDTATEQLQTRSWPQGVLPLAPGPWRPLADGVSGTAPFTFVKADVTFNFQRLRLTISTGYGAGENRVVKATDIEFSALNTSLSTDSSTICTEGRALP